MAMVCFSAAFEHDRLGMTSGEVQVSHVPGIPVAVIRRHARASELPRVVPEGCGAVWNYLRAHQLKGGRNVAIYWDGSIRLEVGVERLRIDPPAQPVRDGRKDPFGNARPEPPGRRRQAVPKRMVVMQHLLRGESQAVENLLNLGVLVAGRLHHDALLRSTRRR